MSCAACSGHVERAVSKVEGVSSCNVNLLTNTLAVEGTASDQKIIEAVERAGYGASVQGESRSPAVRTDDDDKGADKELKTLLRRLISSVIFLLILMYFSMGHSMWNWPLPSFFDDNYVAIGLVEMLLAIVIIVINRKFFISGFKGVFHGSVNMDTLVGMGSGVAFAYSLYVLFALTGAQAVGDADAVAMYAGEPVEHIHDYVLKRAISRVFNHTLKRWAAVVRSCSCLVRIGIDDIIPLIFGKLAASADMTFYRLFVLS